MPGYPPSPSSTISAPSLAHLTMSLLNVTVDPFSVAEPNELPDWRLPLSFMKARHVEKIEATRESDEWRMRDRVRRGHCGLVVYSSHPPISSYLSSPLFTLLLSLTLLSPLPPPSSPSSPSPSFLPLSPPRSPFFFPSFLLPLSSPPPR